VTLVVLSSASVVISAYFVTLRPNLVINFYIGILSRGF
jgi:hypothetical protein